MGCGTANMQDADEHVFSLIIVIVGSESKVGRFIINEEIILSHEIKT